MLFADLYHQKLMKWKDNTRLRQVLFFSLYPVSMGALVFLLKWLQWNILIVNNSMNLYVGLIAVFFTILGTWISKQLVKPKTETIVVEKEVLVPVQEFVRSEAELKKLNLTDREWDTLQLIAQGKSNSEIAEQLFLSVSTVKTHVSNLFIKMDVKRRTQAVEKAKRLRIIG
jgi:two-component system, NarL family, response regulator LiaR